MEQVFAEIKQNVEKEAEHLVSRAKRVAEREIQLAREEAENILKANRAETEKEANIRFERALARINADIRKQILEQQQTFVQKIFDTALEKMKTLPRDDKYEKWLAALFTAAIAQIPDGKCAVFCNEKDASIVKKIITDSANSSVKLSKEFPPISAGIIVKSNDNRLTIDCSAEAEMRKAKDELRDTVLKKLTAK